LPRTGLKARPKLAYNLYMQTTVTPRKASAPWAPLILAGVAAVALYCWKPAEPQNAGGHDLVHWRSDLAAAKTEAKETNKPLLVEFGASWCPDCQWMKSHVWSDASIAVRANSNYIPVSIDDDARPELVVQFDIHEIPEFFVIDQKDGKILKEFRHGAMPSGTLSSWLP
jgi:thiol-disulfide isomerase/thioredoxin